MTIEEAIKHYEEAAEELEKKVKPYQCESINKKLYEVNKKEWDSCLKCVKEYRQLSEWLRELKALKENDDVKDVFKNCNACKYQSSEPDDFPCDRCCHRYLNQYVYDDKREVNADVY